MRTISSVKIIDMVSMLCLKANTLLREDVYTRLQDAFRSETNKRGKKILSAIIDNALIAGKESVAICQDTGMPCVFVEVGQDVHIAGDLKAAIIAGVERGYQNGYFRKSIVLDPLKRGAPGLKPPVIHTDIVKGDTLKITVLPKGFGCENKAQLKMFNPTTGIDQIKQFIIDVVKAAGPDACPPYIVGVGIGGTADYAMYMAKRALLKHVTSRQSPVTSKISKLEKELLKEINGLNIGPMGLGGRTTVLAVNIESYPTHIAGLPVAVNISCHALRAASGIL
ncbi:MAG: fumarate hydratase [Candidatus Omnitrophota bacterium]|jgi:fumarate hydratase subunit alpha